VSLRFLFVGLTLSCRETVGEVAVGVLLSTAARPSRIVFIATRITAFDHVTWMIGRYSYSRV
jgi:hypothetical protein